MSVPPLKIWQLAPAVGAAVIACIALAGAVFGSVELQSFATRQPMVPLTAVCVICGAVALVLAQAFRGRPFVRVVAAAILLIGLLTLGEYVLDRSLGIDGLLGAGEVVPGRVPGRIAANTAVCLILLGVTLALIDRDGGLLRPVDVGGLAIGLVALLALLGHLFDVQGLQRGLPSSPLTPMALPTSLAMVLLSAGLLSARPDGGLAGLAGSAGPGGVLVRRLAPAAILVPIALAYLRLEGQRAGLYGTPEGLALYCASLIVFFGALIVVTGRTLNRVDAARRTVQAREHAILEATVDAVVTIDVAGRVLDFNPAAEAMFGPLGERTLADFVAVGDGLPLGRDMELTARRADGGEFPVEVTITRLDEAFVVHARDITERLEGGRAARRLAALVESSADAIISVTLDQTIRSWNQGAERMYGYRSEEAIGRLLLELIVPPDRRRGVDAMAEEIQREGSINTEVIHVRRDGSTFPVEATASLIRDASGAPAGVSLIARDITARRAGERAVQRLAAIVESSPDAILTFEADGTVGTWNAAAERVYGYTAEEIIGRSVSLLSDLGAPSDGAATLFERLANGESVHEEGAALRKDGRRIDVFYTAFAVRDERGAIHTGGVIARDVTERRRLEAQLRQSQKMEAVGQLAGGIAHDFNNLLTVITGYGELARELVGSAPGGHELAEIERAAQRATALTSQLLVFSRRQMLDPVVLDLGVLVRGLTPMLQRLIGEDITVDVRLAQALPAVRADAAQIEQVIVNLALNARDAMPDGGTLTFETKPVTVDEDGVPVRHVCLTVTDTGVGIERDAIPHIFEPFYTTKPVGEGTGLGLASVHGAVTQSGGRVSVYSEPGRGTAFKIFLPATTETGAREPVAHAGEDGLGGGETLLVCEDEDGVRFLLERILEQAGYRVLAAARPSEALEHSAAEPGRIHGLVSDVIMPDMPGPELARMLHDLRPGMPTLFLSGYTADTVHGRGNLPEGSAFLEKPFDRVSLLRTLRDLLDRAAAT